MKRNHGRSSPRTKVVILGAGFGGIAAAMRLDRAARRDPSLEVTLVNRENFFLFTPMLHEVAASDLDLTHIVNPIQKLVRRVQLLPAEVTSIDLPQKRVHVNHGLDGHPHAVEYDHLVLALGSVTNFFGIPGVEEHALTMKSLGDAIRVRNRLIALLEEANSECCRLRRPLLTFVVAGGGFAGVETLAAINDFAREALRFYTRLSEGDIRMVLVHPGEVVLPELTKSLGSYAQGKLLARGIEVRTNTRVAGFTGSIVELTNGETIAAHTLIWTAGTTPNPALDALQCRKDRGRIAVGSALEVPGWPRVWALGDNASIPDPDSGKPYPPTAQHALRQGKLIAENILAARRGEPARTFRFRTIGQLAAIGRRTGVAEIGGRKFSGFLAWFLWRSVYLAKLPRFEKKVRVALDWTLDLMFSKDLVQFLTVHSPAISRSEGAPREGEASEETGVALADR